MCGICCQSFIKNKKGESTRRAEDRAEDSLGSHWAILPLSCANHNPEDLQQRLRERMYQKDKEMLHHTNGSYAYKSGSITFV